MWRLVDETLARAIVINSRRRRYEETHFNVLVARRTSVFRFWPTRTRPTTDGATRSGPSVGNRVHHEDGEEVPPGWLPVFGSEQNQDDIEGGESTRLHGLQGLPSTTVVSHFDPVVVTILIYIRIRLLFYGQTANSYFP
jgi:hypothetical protein